MIKARFRRRISIASNVIQTIDNEASRLITYCLNCIRRDKNSTPKTGLSFIDADKNSTERCTAAHTVYSYNNIVVQHRYTCRLHDTQDSHGNAGNVELRHLGVLINLERV